MKDIHQLKQQRSAIQEAEPNIRARDLAKRLGISEAELLSLSVNENVIMLSGDFKKLLKELKKMGYVMALTRNEHCVHERKGVYDNIEFYEGAHNMGVAVNPDIDLRFFMNEWHYGMAQIRPHGRVGILYSFQFFNKRGEAVHKIYSTPTSDIYAFHQLVKQFRAREQAPILDIDASPYPEKTFTSDAEINVKGFQDAWRSLQDTHDFFGMLRKYNVQRTQGLRLAPEGFTQRLDNQVVVQTLQMVAEREVSIMCFLHSKGCVQIHTGPIKNLRFYGDWYNVMDPTFNLHLFMPAIQESWIVKKPTADGIVTSLELFDAKGNLIVYFFGARKPGIPELESWREMIAEVSKSYIIENS